MSLMITEYASGYVEDDIADGDISYREQDRFLHLFDDVAEAVEFLTGYSEHAIPRGAEASCCPVTTFEAADTNVWICHHGSEFRHGWDMPDGLGGTWYTDRSWHFDGCTPVERAVIFDAIAPNVYGFKPYWK